MQLTGNLLQIKPDSSDVGQHKITVTVTDNGSPNLGWSQSYTLNVLAANNPPVIDAVDNQTVVKGNAISFTVTASDTDAYDELSFSLSNAPIGMSITKIAANTARIDWSCERHSANAYEH